MRSVFADTEDASDLAARVDAAAAAARRLADARLRIAVVVDRTPRVVLLHESGDVVRDLTYDELFEALALPAEQFDRWTARNTRASRARGKDRHARVA